MTKAMKAEVQEASTVTFSYRDVEFTVPSSLLDIDADAYELFEAGKMLQATKTVLGNQYTDFKDEHGLTAREATDLINAMMKAWGSDKGESKG